MKKSLLLILTITLTSPLFSQSFTKDDIKELKKTLPKELIINADYIEQHVWIKTPLIGTLGKIGMFDTSINSFTHVFYFNMNLIDGSWKSDGIRYKMTYTGSSWLFIENMLILIAPTNKETRQGIGERHEINFKNEESKTDVYTGGVKEVFDIYNNKSVIEWLKNIAQTGNFSRLRIKGSEGYVDKAVKGKGFYPYAKAIYESWEKYQK